MDGARAVDFRSAPLAIAVALSFIFATFLSGCGGGSRDGGSFNPNVNLPSVDNTGPSIGCDALAPDTDGDGVCDTLETEMGSDPLDPDTDGDGLTDNNDLTPGGPGTGTQGGGGGGGSNLSWLAWAGGSLAALALANAGFNALTGDVCQSQNDNAPFCIFTRGNVRYNDEDVQMVFQPRTGGENCREWNQALDRPECWSSSETGLGENGFLDGIFSIHIKNIRYTEDTLFSLINTRNDSFELVVKAKYALTCSRAPHEGRCNDKGYQLDTNENPLTALVRVALPDDGGCKNRSSQSVNDEETEFRSGVMVKWSDEGRYECVDPEFIGMQRGEILSDSELWMAAIPEGDYNPNRAFLDDLAGGTPLTDKLVRVGNLLENFENDPLVGIWQIRK